MTAGQELDQLRARVAELEAAVDDGEAWIGHLGDDGDRARRAAQTAIRDLMGTAVHMDLLFIGWLQGVVKDWWADQEEAAARFEWPPSLVAAEAAGETPS